MFPYIYYYFIHKKLQFSQEKNLKRLYNFIQVQQVSYQYS